MLFLKILPQDAAVIMKALAALPLGESMQTFLRLQQQLNDQPKPAEKPADKPAAANGADQADKGTVN